jgi:hypothetical protein
VDNLFDEDILEEVLRFAQFSPRPPATPSRPSSPSGVPPTPPTASSSSSSSSSSSPSSAAAAKPSTPSFSLHRFSPQAVSEALCSRAKAVTEDEMAVTSPFQQRAMEEGIHYVGGKNDDISVLVAVVGDQEDSPVSP